MPREFVSEDLTRGLLSDLESSTPLPSEDFFCTWVILTGRGECVFFCPRLMDMFQEKTPQLLGLDFTSFVIPDDRKRIANFLLRPSQAPDSMSTVIVKPGPVYDLAAHNHLTKRPGNLSELAWNVRLTRLWIDGPLEPRIERNPYPNEVAGSILVFIHSAFPMPHLKHESIGYDPIVDLELAFKSSMANFCGPFEVASSYMRPWHLSVLRKALMCDRVQSPLGDRVFQVASSSGELIFSYPDEDELSNSSGVPPREFVQSTLKLINIAPNDHSINIPSCSKVRESQVTVSSPGFLLPTRNYRAKCIIYGSIVMSFFSDVNAHTYEPSADGVTRGPFPFDQHFLTTRDDLSSQEAVRDFVHMPPLSVPFLNEEPRSNWEPNPTHHDTALFLPNGDDRKEADDPVQNLLMSIPFMNVFSGDDDMARGSTTSSSSNNAHTAAKSPISRVSGSTMGDIGTSATSMPSSSPQTKAPFSKAGKGSESSLTTSSAFAASRSSKSSVGSSFQRVCDNCGTMSSPEWRKGPSGAKSLCNACGLRFYRVMSRKLKTETAAGDERSKPQLATLRKAISAKAEPIPLPELLSTLTHAELSAALPGLFKKKE